jgi:hypothetical protein
MIGITLSSEQVRTAPVEVRRWLEQAVLASFGWHLPTTTPNELQPAACSVAEVSKVLSLIRQLIPVVNVFFELGHESAGQSIEGLAAFRLVDIQRHVRLQSPQEVGACLQIINDALRSVRAGADAVFVSLDDRGYCFISEETQRSVAALWKEVTASRNRQDTGSAQAQPAGQFRHSAGASPIWVAKAHPAGASVSGELTADGGVARIAS